MDTRLYVMTHKKYIKPDDEQYDGLYHTVHVGRAISDDLGYPGDDTGNNISERNRNWCELTGIYWVWKNVRCDMVGICHYRRYFVENEDFLRREQIEQILEDHQIIVSYSESTDYKDLKEHYSKLHYWKDMELCRQVLIEKYTDYADSFDLCMNTNLFTEGNMMIASWPVFDEYCSWLFDILFEVEKRIDISGYDTFQARVMGYLSERLLRVWILYNRYKVYEAEVRHIDPADRENQIKSVELKRSAVSLILKDLIAGYQKGNYVDLVDSPPIYQCADNKIPVWVCWWQGKSDMPDLVRNCIHSIESNIPRDICELHLITMDNVSDYVTFPQWIIDKYEKGIITLAMLSDILRMGLLYRYGGMWIDATYYLACPIDSSIFKSGFYTQRMESGLWKADVVQGRWAGNLIYGHKGNVLFQFALNSFYLYWFTQDKLIDYYLIDYVVDAAYTNIEEVREQIDSCPCSQPDVMELYKLLDTPFDEGIYSELIRDTQFFKLNHRLNPKKETITGRETFYGHICGKNKKI